MGQETCFLSARITDLWATAVAPVIASQLTLAQHLACATWAGHAQSSALLSHVEQPAGSVVIVHITNLF
jgi:hypothetical protein